MSLLLNTIYIRGDALSAQCVLLPEALHIEQGWCLKKDAGCLIMLIEASTGDLSGQNIAPPVANGLFSDSRLRLLIREQAIVV